MNMRKIPNLILAIILPSAGFVFYLANPMRPPGLSLGLAVNFLLALFVFFLLAPLEYAREKFDNYYDDQILETNTLIVRSIILFIVFILCGYFVMEGININALRYFMLFLIWIIAMLGGEYLAGVLWRLLLKDHPDGQRKYYAKDNMGTRHNSADETSSYWFSRNASPKKDPFVIYTFDSAKDAREALLELPCIHIASDTGELICTEVLIFGSYQVDKGEHEAIICGSDLTYNLWEIAKNSFINHGGKPKGQGDLAPKKKTSSSTIHKKADVNQIRFVGKDRQKKKMGAVNATFVYEIYRGPDAESAKKFLAKKSVSKQHYYIIVETPEGNYGLDIDGIYKE